MALAHIRRTLQLGALMLAVLGLCWLSVQFFRGSSAVAAVWPANAIILAFIMRWTQSWRTRGLVLAAACAVRAAANLAMGSSPVLSFGFPLANEV